MALLPRSMLAVSLCVMTFSPLLVAQPEGGGTLAGPVIPDAFRVLFALTLVILAVVALAWVSKKLGLAQTGGRRYLRLREQLVLGHKERLILVDFAGETLLLGVTSQQIQLLQGAPQLPEQGESLSPLAARNTADFQKKLHAFLTKGHK
jgi:flagellar protein FliO/FliZ